MTRKKAFFDDYDRDSLLAIINNSDSTDDEIADAIWKIRYVAKLEDIPIFHSFLDSPNKDIVLAAFMTLRFTFDVGDIKDKIIQFASDMKDGSCLSDFAMYALVEFAKEDQQMLDALIRIAESYKTIDDTDEYDYLCWESNNAQAWQELAELVGDSLSEDELDELCNFPFSEKSEMTRDKIRKQYKTKII
jgi:hypothetical protein